MPALISFQVGLEMPIAETGAASAVFDAVLKKLAASMVMKFGGELLNSFKTVEIDFGEHLRHSFDRCSRVRTILNRDDSVELLSLYVNLKFLKEPDLFIDDYDLLDKICDNGKFVIYGSGGGGKTIFMKYLWLSVFETRQDRIPLFVELRKFNEITSEDFSAFLFHSIIGNKSKLKLSDFEQALRGGAFVLLLDGFDEISDDRRVQVEAEILRLSKNYENLSIVVSTRPDQRFHGWQNFASFKVMPLNQKQVIDLIGKLNYNEQIKRKFIQRIRKDLYRRHRSFLSSPLLATMMLLTFDQFADIPEKVYLFYDQAFETLFAKHDATKEAYKRKSYTSLSIDVF